MHVHTRVLPSFRGDTEAASSVCGSWNRYTCTYDCMCEQYHTCMYNEVSLQEKRGGGGGRREEGGKEGGREGEGEGEGEGCTCFYMTCRCLTCGGVGGGVEVSV